MDVQYISYNSKIINSDRCSDEYMKINSCGWGEYRKNLKVTRPNGRLDYQIIYMAKGFGSFNGTILNEGEMYIYRPNEPQEYISLSDNYRHYWIHFTGKAADMLFKGSEYNVIRSSFTKQFENFCKETVRIHSMPNISYQQTMITESKLVSLLASISNELETVTDSRDKRIEKVMRYIQENPDKSLTNQQYAEMINMSKFYFIRRFNDIVGTTPQKYRLNILLEKSLLLLEDSSIRISEIASELGFEDTYYFSKLFKKQFGVSPSKYRK